MATPDSLRGKAVLTLAHVAGMIDLVALPLWIGALMQYYRFSPSQAGITVTVFLLGVVLASAFFAPRFNRVPRRAAAAGGFAVAALAFYVASRQAVALESFQSLAALHVVAGLGVGCALSFTHGSIGRSRNPHRLFATVSVLLGVFAVAFLGGMPPLIQNFGATWLFSVIAGLMALAAVVMALGFPETNEPGAAPSLVRARMPGAAWFIIGVVMCLTLNQAMVFSFVERIGAERGFGMERVNGVLIALGLVNLIPGALAAFTQKKLSPVAVGIAGLASQAVLALVISGSQGFAPYALATSFYVFIVIFTHTFLFGLLSRLDPSGRAVAATPAMMMVGSCIGPALGGAIVQGLGYAGLGWAACAVSLIAITALLQVRRHLPEREDAPTLAVQTWKKKTGRNDEMLTLYGAMASRAHRVVWMLKELGLDFEHVQTNFMDGSTRQPEFLTLNPNGRVPVLDDDGFLIHESMAINLYLARKYGFRLAPEGLQQEALAVQWSFWVVTEVEKPLLFASANRKLFAEDARDEEQAAMAVAKLDRPFKVLDAHLASQPFLLGDRFTVADLNVATVMDLAPQCGISLADWPHLQAWHQGCLDRPAAADWRDVTFRIPRPPTTLGLLRMFV